MAIAVGIAAALALPARADDGAQARAEVLAADRAFAAATAARGLDGWLDFFAEDATIFPPGEAAITGLPAIRSYYARVGFDPRGLRWEPSSAAVAASGDLAYSYGRWTAGNGGAAAHGKYVSVWKRAGRGPWRVVLDIGNADPSPGETKSQPSQ